MIGSRDQIIAEKDTHLVPHSILQKEQGYSSENSPAS
jgi:hypothetical protein